MDKLAGLTAFVKVAEAESFAKAAREMGLSRSQVNRQVIALEDELGVTLLARTTRQVSLTPTGQAFYLRAKSILNDLQEAETAIQSDHAEPQGDLKINAPMSFGTLHLSSALADFMTRYPNIRVQLVLDDRFVDPVSEGFDITVRVAETREAPSLIEHTIVEAKRLLCASPGYLQQHGRPRTIKELASRPCLHYGNLASGYTWRLRRGDAPETSVRVNGVLCCNNAEALRDAAVAGLGVALLPTFIAGPELQTGRLVSVLPEYQAPPVYLSLLYPPNRHLAARVRVFVKYMQDRFGDPLYWDLIS
ncbi:LysR family transcriptional regulator [Hahella sp. NBU794]|uniref:LysR family transcriptional regulator n=1 Tax=Hahella sp. NBU794 TaxID=3422590 RepID=UPI003D6E301B